MICLNLPNYQPSAVCCLTGPTTTKKTFSNSEGRLVFPDAEEKHWPSHSGFWTIEATTLLTWTLTVSYNVDVCINCTCDVIKVIQKQYLHVFYLVSRNQSYKSISNLIGIIIVTQIYWSFNYKQLRRASIKSRLLFFHTDHAFERFPFHQLILTQLVSSARWPL